MLFEIRSTENHSKDILGDSFIHQYPASKTPNFHFKIFFLDFNLTTLLDPNFFQQKWLDLKRSHPMSWHWMVCSQHVRRSLCLRVGQGVNYAWVGIGSMIHTHPTQAHLKFNMDQWIPNIEGLRYPLHPFNFAPTLSIHIEYQAPSLWTKNLRKQPGCHKMFGFSVFSRLSFEFVSWGKSSWFHNTSGFTDVACSSKTPIWVDPNVRDFQWRKLKKSFQKRSGK